MSAWRSESECARSGDQHGGDGGVSGAGGRHLIFEARRYRDDTRLDERSILGEIQQAVERAPYLEVWILVTTREVPEQTQLAITKSAEERGNRSRHHRLAVPSPLPQLAAYSLPGIQSASRPRSAKGMKLLLAKIAAMPDFDVTLKATKSELDSWAIGYESGATGESYPRSRDLGVTPKCNC